MVLNEAPHAESQRALQCVAGSWWKLGKRNQGVHIPINTSNLAENIFVLEAQYQQLTPFTSIVPLNFEAATASRNPEGFTVPV